LPSNRQTPRTRIAARRFRRRRIALGVVLAAGAGIAGVSLAGAADPSLSDRIDSAQSSADQLSSRIDAQSAKVDELQQRARQAGAQAMVIEAEIERTARDQRRLAGELGAARKQLQEVQARYGRAVKVLSRRLVEIYESPEPDALALLLSSDGFDDLASRAEYLDALHQADATIADRVAALRAEVKDRYDRVAELKSRLDAEARRLAGARSEFAAAQASAQRRASALAGALASNQADLGAVQSRLAELEAQRQEQQQSSSGSPAFSGGPYSIPTYIVICESGGDYHAVNPSSGAGGAYQILPSTWRAYGGKGLPQNASKAEQDRIAALIWADSGPGAWSCA
jgi:peptidoglycan hydrolase CwlO-like protein